MDEKKIAIQVRDLEKAYRLYDKPSDRLRESLGLARKRRYKEHFALKGVDLTIFQGETVGIIGTNGSGKSTILKIITGVLNPTGGSVNVNGRISALLELGAGFNMEYNGIENVYLNGTMIGFSEKEIDERLDDILNFADIGEYVYQPVKTYSSGMFVRLAFAVAINIDPEILIVDEALSVGDVFFQAKCYHKFEEFKEMGKTIVFVSHDLSSISKYCDRVVLLNQGVKLGEGTPKEMIDAYKQVLVGQYPLPGDDGEEEPQDTQGQQEDVQNPLYGGEEHPGEGGVLKNPELLEYGTRAAVIEDYYVTDESGRKSSAIIKGQKCEIHMTVRFFEDIEEPIFAFTVKNIRGVEITGTNTMVEKAFLDSVGEGNVKHITFTQKIDLQGGEYLLSLGVTGYENEEFKVYHRLYDVMELTVISDKDTVGYFDTNSRITVESKEPEENTEPEKNAESEENTGATKSVPSAENAEPEDSADFAENAGSEEDARAADSGTLLEHTETEEKPVMRETIKEEEKSEEKERAEAEIRPEQIGKVRLNFDCYSGEDLYSDGDIEDEILFIVKSCGRGEYPAVVESRRSWPILYHLSPLRGNIVDWLPIGPEDKVLEIGSGCGAITENLSEKAGSVTCVDLSLRRSQINAYRNQDRDNIEIYLGNFGDIEPGLPTDYDFVCMIGVFEYGKSYIHTQTPYEDFLKIILRHIKDNGRIVIAIENQFGLKYWAGCTEDHLGDWFSNLEGYPDGGSARTFTRPGLEKIMENCGIKEYFFYYPYPDYKFPTVIYSDKRLPNQGELTDNIRNFDRNRVVLFNEKYVYDSAIKDGMFDTFSNSYLVVIGKDVETAYVKYSNDRADKYTLRTEIVDTPQEGRVVRKIPMSDEARGHVRGMSRSFALLKERYAGSGLHVNPCRLTGEGYAEFTYENGVTLEELLDQCLERDDLEGFYRLFDRYYELISWGQDRAVTDYDLIFANIMVDGERWSLIDYEWTMKRRISPAEVAFRAVYCYVLEEEKRRKKLDWSAMMDRLGILPRMEEEFRLREIKFQVQVTGKRKSMGEIRAAIGTIPYPVHPGELIREHLRDVERHRIQVYYDQGYGFYEEESRYFEDIYTDERNLEVEIPFGGEIRALRIDPANCPCIMKLTGLALNGVDLFSEKAFSWKKHVEVNGSKMKGGCYVFETADPNILIRFSELPLEEENRLTVKMELTVVSVEMAEDLIDSLRRIW